MDSSQADQTLEHVVDDLAVLTGMLRPVNGLDPKEKDDLVRACLRCTHTHTYTHMYQHFASSLCLGLAFTLLTCTGLARTVCIHKM